MRVILRDSVRGLGRRGDIVDVSDGYARNYLFPQGLALRSSTGNEAQAERMRAAQTVRDARERAAAEEIAKVLVPAVIRVEARTGGEGRLFGSVAAAEIADAVYAQTGVELGRRSIELAEAIKTVGEHSVPARLHSDVTIFLQVEVVGR
ncbi:MAG: 50S ribosomal protein L9 [Actinobacteria bacterium]|nr:50S ribosomal protein L9 [Actinomycetota bacterium]